MKIVIYGLSVSSSWGNGHATLWRGLIRALARKGHEVVFFEKDVPYYAGQRDLWELPGGELILYSDWDQALELSKRHLDGADVAMVTSYCPNGVAATDLVLASKARSKCFYDLDTPVTLDRLEAGEDVFYLGPRGLADFDLVLSYTGGSALSELQTKLGARRVAPLYGSVDPDVHRPVAASSSYASDVSYLGTYAEDRQERLDQLFITPARLLPDKKFLIGGAMYPQEFPWTNNIYFVRHLPPSDHPAFYSSSRLTVNVTRRAMAAMGYCPSGRMFEAAACGVPVLTDSWEGLDAFFEPGSEVLIGNSTQDALDAISLSDDELARIAKAARARTLDEHTADKRAVDFENAIQDAMSRRPHETAGVA
ncbi:MAG: hypothetical protein QOJ65_2111 [Fimbriimonadaceae bacterium]|jgi:spore maturation protein CgeB|nr:hypothetical protein [Fimbriimonadaceae bacterium]